MGTTTDFAKQAKMREFIEQLDRAIEMARDMRRQIDCIDLFLEEKFPTAKAA